MSAASVLEVRPAAVRPLRDGVIPGAIAGIGGGLVFGAAMSSLGSLPTVASIVRADSPYVGFAVHMLIATLVGIGFGLLVSHQRAQTSELLFWGLAYGAFWWFLGPQTLLPLVLGKPLAWDLESAQRLLPSLIGHLYYGATTALVFAALSRTPSVREHLRPWTLVRGEAAGLIATAVMYLGFGLFAGASLNWLPVIGAVLGIGYPLLFTGRPEGAGPAVIRGASYGFLWWIVAGLTLPPLFSDGDLDWSRAAATEAAGRLPAYILLGAATAAIFTWLGALSRSLFNDNVKTLHDEAPGARGLRATGYGILAGLVGGLVYMGVMLVVDLLPKVAALVGAEATGVGLVVHLLVAQFIGVSYALLFRRRSFDLASGLGWGVCYGFLWWILGWLTLLPVLLGDEPRWSAQGMAAVFPALVGHLAYGAAIGTIYYRLEARANPWWATRNEVEAERVAARQDQTLGAAPALWVLTLLVSIIIPMLVT